MADQVVETGVTKEQLDKEFVSVEAKMQGLQTAVYGVVKYAPFLGSVLQCLDIYYTHEIPRAGIMFNTNSKKWEMAIHPYWFCEMLNSGEREAVLLHEIYHVTHKHPMRAPFLKINEKRRSLMNVAMDMAINQYIQNLPNGCPNCPPMEALEKGEECPNPKCPGKCIDVGTYSDADKAGKKTPWPTQKPMEFYYHKLVERYDSNEEREPNVIAVEHVFTEPLVCTSSGCKASKILTAANHGSITAFNAKLVLNKEAVLVAQDDAKDNGIYTVLDVGSDNSPFKLKRCILHNGLASAPVYIRDCAVQSMQKVAKGKKPKGWVVIGTARADDSDMVDVDIGELLFEEQDMNGKAGSGNGSGKGIPMEYDSHRWDGSSEEGEMMDATEDLVKRAMQKRSLSYDKLPGFVQDLLKEIEARRSELNYRQLILSAIKRSASGFDRNHSWTRKSRRFGNLAPGTKNSELPKLDTYIDTSGSISIEEANEFLSIIDEFLKVGSRKCNLGLWHTDLYHFKPYRLGDRLDRKLIQSGGTDLDATLKKIWETKPDLSIILTDGCYGNVEVEQWMRPGEHFPQVLWIISKEGSESHPLKRLGETIKIPKTEVMKGDKALEK